MGQKVREKFHYKWKNSYLCTSKRKNLKTKSKIKEKVIKIADLLKTHRELTDTNNILIGERLGTPVEKGIVLNEDYLIRN